MANDKGSMVVIVLVFLGIIGLLGVALISQSRLDLQFSQSVSNYDKMFSTADGAAAFALRYLQNDAKKGYCFTCTNPTTHAFAACKDRLGTNGADQAGDATPANWPAPWSCTMQVPLPNGMSNCTAYIVRELTVTGGGGSNPTSVYYRIIAQASRTPWTTVGVSAPNSTIQMSVMCGIPSGTTCP